MCGIHAILAPTQSLPDLDLPPELKRCLVARGPDHFGQVDRQHTITTDDSTTATEWSLRFTSTVLALRGDHVARQPLSDARTGSVLCWNGEAWRVDGRRVEAGENDGEVVFARLVAASSSSSDGGVEAVLEVLRGIEGPFAFVYYDASAGRVFFGRDRLGRRSLLMAAVGGGLALCSIAAPGEEGWREVEADGVYVVTVGQTVPKRHDWVVGEGAADFVSTCGQSWDFAPDRGGLSCQTYSTCSRSPALASSIGRCRLGAVH
jgi:asparagine synthetase B (glutamine-hydrolysing)